MTNFNKNKFLSYTAGAFIGAFTTVNAQADVIDAEDVFIAAGANTIICETSAACGGVYFRSNVLNDDNPNFMVFAENFTNFDDDPNTVNPDGFTFSPRAQEAPDEYDTDWHGPFEGTDANIFFGVFDIADVSMVSIDVLASDFASGGDPLLTESFADAVLTAYAYVDAADQTPNPGADTVLDSMSLSDLLETDPFATLSVMSFVIDINYVTVTIPDGNVYLNHFVFEVTPDDEPPPPADSPAVLSLLMLGLLGLGTAAYQRRKK